MSQKTSKVAEYKKKEVEDLVKFIQSYKAVGIINMEDMPAPQLQRMRAQFRGKALIYMSKFHLIKLAFGKAKEQKKGLEKLEEFLKGMPALLLTNENPFKIASKINKSKTSAPAKPNQTATKDIIIPSGQTPFAPGPVISELSSIGLRTGVEAGKVVIKEEFTAAKEGDKISPKVADVLMKLGIEPMEVGLNLVAIYEDGAIYDKKVLSWDEEKFMQLIKEAAIASKALAIEISYAAKETIAIMLGKAQIIAEKINASLKLPERKEEKKKEKEEEKPKIGEKEEEKKKDEEEEKKAEEQVEAEKKEQPEEIKEVKEEEQEKEIKEDKELEKKEEAKKEKLEEKQKETVQETVPSTHDLAKRKEAGVSEQMKPDKEKRIKTKISEDFKEEIRNERERRDKLFDESTGEVEKLTEELKRKGTLRK